MRTLLALPEERPVERSPLGEWIDQAKPKPKRKATAKSMSGYDRAREEAAERVTAGDWGDAGPAAFVGFYALMHEKIYGVAPAELVDAWKGAVSAARGMLDKDFGGKPIEMLEFLRWTWKRERARETKRRAEGTEGGRIGWVLQFKSRALLTDYRVEESRAQEAAKRSKR